MNILLRHTFSSVLRNPVQSVIVVISTAMITACILLCLCITSLFEFSTSLWANSAYAGSQMIVFTDTAHEGDVKAWLDDNPDKVTDYVEVYEHTVTVMSDISTMQTIMMGVDKGMLDDYDSLTGAETVARAENDTELPSAHISVTIASILGIGVGEVLSVKNYGDFFVEAVCSDTARYYANPTPAFACEVGENAKSSIRFIVWFADAYGIGEDGRENIESYSDAMIEITDNVSAVQTSARESLKDAASSVEGSMRLMKIAAAVITVVMACLLFSSFSIIVRGRVNELVKFKAAGATPSQSALILLFEAAFYALAGGLIGLGVGEGLVSQLNSMTASGGAVITPSAANYVLALVIGTACGLAACVIPAVRMSMRPIHALTGGSERMAKPVNKWAAAVIAAATLGCALATFFVPTSARVPVDIIAIVLVFICTLTVMPYVLRGVCAAARKVTRPGAAYISECALPRSASVNSAFTVLVALIAFITLGTCLIDTVKTTGTPSTTRYGGDFVVSFDQASSYDAESELQRCLGTDGITGGAKVSYVYSVYLAYPDHTLVGETLVDAAFRLHIVDKGADINYCTTVHLPEETVALFDKTLAEGGHPIVLSRYYADKYGFALGSKVAIIAATHLGDKPFVNTFTVVGIDDTVTSWDYVAFIAEEDAVAQEIGAVPRTHALYLTGDTSRFAELRESIDTDYMTLYTREGYYPVEKSSSAESDRMLSVFSVIIYTIAALGLVNLVVITARERVREFDILRLAGMTAADAAKGIAAETALLSLAGLAVGLLFSVFTNASSLGIAQIIDRYLVLDPLPVKTAVIAVVGAGIFALLWAASHMAAYLRSASARYRKREDRLLRSD